MNTAIILTVLGPDRPGLVQALSEVLNKQQGNWTDSRMIHLGGKFAGLLQVSLPTANVAQLKQDLAALETQGLQITVEQAGKDSEDAPRLLQFEVLGQDRPGIIHDITRQLADLNVNIEELCSEQRPAPMSGGTLFFASLSLSLPQTLSTEAVQDALEALADPLMVDVNFDV